MNRRLAVPLVLLLLFLLAGAVWALLGPLHLARVALKPAAETPHAAATAPQAGSAEKGATLANAPPASKDGPFDVVRIDPNGTSVFAGRTEPGAEVTIKADGKDIGKAQADENGEWTFTTEQKFASADPELGVAVKRAGEVKNAAANLPPASAAGEPQRAQAPAEPEKPHTAKAVTATLLENLKGMVDAARSGAPEPSLKPPATPQGQSPPAQSAQAQPPQEKTAGQSTSPDAGAAARNSVTAARLPAPEAGETVRKSIPVPVTFVFNEATFTSDGRKAAELLLEYLKLKHFKKVALTGHADERGSDDLNMELSRERLQTVSDFLKAGGFGGELQLEPKGKREPYLGVVRTEYNQEELWQLDRRVELVISPDDRSVTR